MRMDSLSFVTNILSTLYALLCKMMTWLFYNRQRDASMVPISVNYHFDRRCNYKCGFCFHVNNNSYIAPLSDAKKALKKLADGGMKKINFAGGEPFLQPRFLGNLVTYCKEELGVAVSIVSNGSKIKRNWFVKYGKHLDILAISCDSFNEDVNEDIGRHEHNLCHIQQMRNVAEWCRLFNVKFKINSVICSLNWQEDLSPMIKELKPFRWKCFQVLILDNENGVKTERNASRFTISKGQFEQFCERHKHLPCFVPESNEVMQNSYLILDEHLRFLNCQNGKKEPSQSLLEVSVETALSQAGWDRAAFEKRGGIYDYHKDSNSVQNVCNSYPSELQW